MAARILPPQSYLRECFDYDPETGVLTWKARPRRHFISDREWKRFNSRHAAKTAGHFGAWGREVALDTIGYKVHRIIWKLMTSDEPAREVDHVNRDATDNRWTNLRLATPSENARNRRTRSDSLTGFKGVWESRGRFYVRIALGKSRVRLGGFSTAEEAHAAYCDAAKRLHGTFWHHG